MGLVVMTLPAGFDDRPRTVAHTVAGFLARSGVTRIYGLTGSHIKPLWEEATHAGIRVIDVRHEVAAVHMAQAEADLTGELAVATVTTGPGLTNAITGLAAAYQGRSPILVLSAIPPRDQLGLGALEEVPQVELVRPVTRLAKTVAHSRLCVPLLQAAFSAAVGNDGLAGPAYLDFPTDVLRELDGWTTDGEAHCSSRRATTVVASSDSLEAAAAAIRGAQRPVVISGKGAAHASRQVTDFVEACGAVYLDTPESRGLLAADNPAHLPAVRAAAMAEADTVITLGRRFDFSLAYGSSAVFSSAERVVRIGTSFEELGENRAGDVQVRGSVPTVLQQLVAAGVRPAQLDTSWLEALRAKYAQRRQQWSDQAQERPLGPDGAIHPNALIAELNRALAGRDPLFIADGGDILSFARVGLEPSAVLDTGTFGCLGVGVPFAVAAALLHPERPVVALIGDGAFGFNAMELDTARRSGARPVFVLSNNEAWNIERIDHVEKYGGNPRFNSLLPG
jgi:acetolactate synthase-1/2/3 large subunit